ncbi:MAG: hypothetical protein QGI00_09630 [Candidatus Marinimicrobia bacterium]|nr:hypothetical protein [Candidatus Neomarinimicrobiota bacterium]
MILLYCRNISAVQLLGVVVRGCDGIKVVSCYGLNETCEDGRFSDKSLANSTYADGLISSVDFQKEVNHG